MQPRPISALLRRELAGSFSNPTAYVFITLFVFMSGVAAFWGEMFFLRNIASLDELNAWFPALLLLLVPAITMGAWAEERKQGTDEVLLTLPAREWQLALGKYLGCCTIYGVCMLFAASHVLVLAYLGRPDVGLMASTYLGYLLAGCALCALGLLASSLSGSATIAFIAAAATCGLLVGLGLLEGVLTGRLAPLAELLAGLSVPKRLENFGRGVISAGDVAYFLAIGAIGVGLTALVLRRRRRVGLSGAGDGLHAWLRLASMVAIGASVVLLVDRAGARADATSERLWTLSEPTRQIARAVPADQPVSITAYVSPTLPGAGGLAQQRAQLLGTMADLAAASSGRISTRVIELQPGTPEARDADRAFGIKPRQVPGDAGAGGTGAGSGSVVDAFLAVVVQGAGGEVSTVPFLARGLSPEYELARAVRAVGTSQRKTIGIVETPAGVFGQFDFQMMQARPDWPIVTELRKQYNVQRVSPQADFDPKLDVLVVAQPSSLSAEGLQRVVAWVKAGRAALIWEDPLPLVNATIATAEPRRPSQSDPSPQPKPDLLPLWQALGVKMSGDAVVWDSYNPRPALDGSPGEFLWLRPRKGGFDPFAQGSAVTSGLREVALLFAGRLEKLDAPAPAKEGEPAPAPASLPTVTPLLTSAPTSAHVPYAKVMTRNMFGMPALDENRQPVGRGASAVLAAHVQGGADKVNAIVVADLDAFSPSFFNLREAGNTELDFDNVTMVLNAIDQLAGDTGLLDLRKKRREHRTLERIDQRRQTELEDTLKIEEAARQDAQTRVAEARARLDAKVQEVEKRTDLDQTTRAIMLESVRRAEQTRLDAQAAAIEGERQRRVEDARLESRQNIGRIEGGVRTLAVVLPPVPALLTGLFVLARRRQRAERPRT